MQSYCFTHCVWFIGIIYNDEMSRKEAGVNEIRMLRWMCGGETKKDEIRNEHVRGSVKVALVEKREGNHMLRRIPERRRRRTQHTR